MEVSFSQTSTRMCAHRRGFYANETKFNLWTARKVGRSRRVEHGENVVAASKGANKHVIACISNTVWRFGSTNSGATRSTTARVSFGACSCIVGSQRCSRTWSLSSTMRLVTPEQRRSLVKTILAITLYLGLVHIHRYVILLKMCSPR